MQYRFKVEDGSANQTGGYAREEFVHGESPIEGGSTLCGLSTDGCIDPTLDQILSVEMTAEPINCPHCMDIIEYCRHVKTRKMSKKQLKQIMDNSEV